MGNQYCIPTYMNKIYMPEVVVRHVRHSYYKFLNGISLRLGRSTTRIRRKVIGIVNLGFDQHISRYCPYAHHMHITRLLLPFIKLLAAHSDG